MKKMIKISLVTALLSITAFAETTPVSVVKPSVVSEKKSLGANFASVEAMNKHFEELNVFKSMKVDFVSNKQIGESGMYILKGRQANGNLLKIITDVKGEYIVVVDQQGQAQVADIKNQKALTTPVDMSLVLSKPEAFTYGNGAKHLYVFTDPECPVCKEFEKMWETIKDDVTLHVYFYNLDYHKEANVLTQYIMAGATNEEKASRLIAIANGSEEYKTKKLTPEEEKIAASFIIDGKEIGNKIIVEGTPTILDENGESINWPKLIKPELLKPKVPQVPQK